MLAATAKRSKKHRLTVWRTADIIIAEGLDFQPHQKEERREE